jgi:hypothetical protein
LLDSSRHACHPTAATGARQAAFTRPIRAAVRFSRYFYT